MEGDEAHPMIRHRTTKRNFSAMAASHRDETPDSLYDDHYQNTDHAARRRRLHVERERLQMPHPRTHYPGDGLDFRRPVMYAARGADETENRQRHGSVNASQRTLIDLTDEGGTTEESQGSERPQRPTSAASLRPHVAASSSHQHGLPVIDIGSSGDEGDYGRHTPDYPHQHRPHRPHRLPSHHHRRRPQFGSLRRPERRPSPHPSSHMDEIEFVESRPLSRAQTASRQITPAAATTRHHRNVTPYPATFNETIDLTEDNDDDIAYLDTRPVEGVNGLPGPTAGTGTHGAADPGGMGIGRIADMLTRRGHMSQRLMRTMQNIAGMDGLEELAQHRDQAYRAANDIERMQRGERAHHHHHHHHHHHARDPARLDGLAVLPPLRRAAQLFHGNMPNMPGMMDYVTTAGFAAVGGQNGPQTPKYTPPDPPGEGFTRNPAEDEVVVCPNCGDELAMGESELKQQVWVIKGCGHAYCGECTQHRIRTPSKKKSKGKAPVTDDPTLPPPFKKCVVEGCNNAASKNSMIHVYLGN